MAPLTCWVLSPGWRPAGGVLKILDYALHARDLGLRPVLCSPQPVTADLTAFRVPGLDVLRDLEHRTDLPAIGPEDVVFFSWPTHWAGIAPRLPRGYPLARTIHIIQNVRHANPRWLGGYASTLLGRPLTRIAINDVTLGAIRPQLSTALPTAVVPLGHRAEWFARAREGDDVGDRPLRVGYTTWKSDVGDRVAARLTGDGGVELRGLGGDVAWDELRELYHWSDVFLCCPGPEEGFYLPGLEAMAAGAVVVTPDAVGNRAYCRFGENCALVPFEDDAAIALELQELATDPERRARLRAEGYAEVPRHSLEREREGFDRVLEAALATDDGPRHEPNAVSGALARAVPPFGSGGFRRVEKAVCGPRLARLRAGRLAARWP